MKIVRLRKEDSLKDLCVLNGYDLLNNRVRKMARDTTTQWGEQSGFMIKANIFPSFICLIVYMISIVSEACN